MDQITTEIKRRGPKRKEPSLQGQEEIPMNPSNEAQVKIDPWLSLFSMLKLIYQALLSLINKKPFPYKITTAYLHQAITCPGLTGGEKTINDTRFKGVSMKIIDEGLMIEGKGKITLVPMANVANLILVPLE